MTEKTAAIDTEIEVIHLEGQVHPLVVVDAILLADLDHLDHAPLLAVIVNTAPLYLIIEGDEQNN